MQFFKGNIEWEVAGKYLPFLIKGLLGRGRGRSLKSEWKQTVGEEGRS